MRSLLLPNAVEVSTGMGPSHCGGHTFTSSDFTKATVLPCFVTLNKLLNPPKPPSRGFYVRSFSFYLPFTCGKKIQSASQQHCTQGDAPSQLLLSLLLSVYCSPIYNFFPVLWQNIDLQLTLERCCSKLSVSLNVFTAYRKLSRYRPIPPSTSALLFHRDPTILLNCSVVNKSSAR